MQTKTKYQIMSGCSALMLAALCVAIINSHPKKPNPDTTAYTSSNTDAVQSEPTTYTTQTQVPVCEISVAATAATQDTHPIYMFNNGTFATEYPEDIQEIIWNHYNDFEGTLPPYLDVLALWISESGLDPDAYDVNENGTCDWGIPQLNDTAIAECVRQGWFEGTLTDFREDPDLQVELGLKILNYYCETCPGGDYPYYRAIRAYALGEAGLAHAEANGNFGSDDTWSEGSDGKWYPGKYGEMKAVERYLVPAT